MKFWKTTLFSIFLIACLLSGLVFHILHITPEDEERYRELMDVSNSKTSLKSNTNYTAKQLKEGTTKTLLLSQGDERRAGYLTSQSSILYFAKEEKSSELIEEMKKVQLIYQEELFEDFQIVVFLESDAATYFYNQERLMAENVHIQRYKLPSHELPKSKENGKPLFAGTADQMTIAFGKDHPTMQAVNLKAASE